MLRKLTWLVAFVGVVLTVPLSAQDKRVEASFLVGWTFSDGVSTDDNLPFFGLTDGLPYNRVDPKDSFKWGFTAGFLATPNVEVGFQFGQQNTQLEASGEVFGTPARELGDLTVSTYHGYFNYNFLEEDSPIRPYAFFGLGATNFGSVDINTPGGGISTSSDTQFSTTWGAGVKFFPNPSFGIRAGVQWTPTYMKTDSEGWWCDPYYWGACWVVGDAQYSNQWDLGGGVIFRF